MAVVRSLLYALGFTPAGIAAGSVAARMMSLAAMANGGRVAAGSMVAVAQSLGECCRRGGRGCTPCFGLGGRCRQHGRGLGWAWGPLGTHQLWGARCGPAGLAVGTPDGSGEVGAGGGCSCSGCSLPNGAQRGAPWRGWGARADFSSSSSGAAGFPTAVKAALSAIGAVIRAALL